MGPFAWISFFYFFGDQGDHRIRHVLSALRNLKQEVKVIAVTHASPMHREKCAITRSSSQRPFFPAVGHGRPQGETYHPIHYFSTTVYSYTLCLNLTIFSRYL